MNKWQSRNDAEDCDYYYTVRRVGQTRLGLTYHLNPQPVTPHTRVLRVEGNIDIYIRLVSRGVLREEIQFAIVLDAGLHPRKSWWKDLQR